LTVSRGHRDNHPFPPGIRFRRTSVSARHLFPQGEKPQRTNRQGGINPCPMDASGWAPVDW
jgi:hypothetical protein